MLILNRHPGEDVLSDIVIGDSIVVRVLSVLDDGRVDIGISAPDSVPVYRRELYRAIMTERGAVTPGGHLAPGRSSGQRPSVSLRGRGEVPAGPAGYDGRRAGREVGRDIGRDSSGVRLGSGRPVVVEEKGRAGDRGGSLGPYGYPEGLGGGRGGEGGGV